jgi:hypothetical protein
MLRMRYGCTAILVVAICILMGACSSAPVSLTLSPSSAQAIDETQTVSISATVANSHKGVTWSLSGPGSLSGTTSPTVIYTPPAPSGVLPAVQQATVTATSIADPTKTASEQITVNQYPSIPFQTIPNGQVGVPYTEPIQLFGGTSPFQWNIDNSLIATGWKVGGAIPDGLKLDPSNGVLSGTPTAAGTWYFQVDVTDATGVVVSNGFLSVEIASVANASAKPVPFLNQTLVPSAVSPGGAAFSLKVSGAGFVSGATVNFNGAALSTTFVDSEHLTAVVPASATAKPGTAAVTVVNPTSAAVQSNLVYFPFAAPQSTVNFTATNSPLQMYGPAAIGIADFNEDGKPDLVIAAGIEMFVFLGNGDGTFTAATGSPMKVPSPPYDDFGSPYVGPIALGDFNNSGHLGFAVGEYQNLGAIIFLGNGDGTFTLSSAQVAYVTGEPIGDVKAADFNADGNLDLAICGQTSGYSTVDLGYGKGAFTTAGQIYSTAISNGEVVGDFNQDGKLDVLIAGGGAAVDDQFSGLNVSLGNGDGTFRPLNPVYLGNYYSAIVTADFNGDGKLDLAVTDSDANTVTILLGNGDGTFGIPTTYFIGKAPQEIIAADFNNDGKLDLATANSGDNTVTLLLGNGDGTFTQAANSPYSASNGSFQLAAADFNGDGKLDLAVVNIFAGTVSILLQQ